jgi:hypothetical protein
VEGYEQTLLRFDQALADLAREGFVIRDGSGVQLVR